MAVVSDDGVFKLRRFISRRHFCAGFRNRASGGTSTVLGGWLALGRIVALRYMEGAPTSCKMVTYAYAGNTVFRVSCDDDCRVLLS
ncbi:hypothetical protein HZ326_15423 [Fusarium oxysporum f. sp. albedinis]|jgi:hypothetical protein|nr:hypothetical protein HZ326_15423 [Fusarium oxysporum f. sp. albedinis]